MKKNLRASYSSRNLSQFSLCWFSVSKYVALPWNYLPNRESATTPITSSSYVSKLEREGSTRAVSVVCSWRFLVRGLRALNVRVTCSLGRRRSWMGMGFSVPSFACPYLSSLGGFLFSQHISGAPLWDAPSCPTHRTGSPVIYFWPVRDHVNPKAPNQKDPKSLLLALANALKHSLNAFSLLHLKRVSCFMASLRYLI